MVLEVRATQHGIEHVMAVPAPWAATVENLLQAHVPGVRYEPVANGSPSVQRAAEYRLTTGGRLLRVDAPALSARLLTSLQPLLPGEQVVVQWIVSPAGPVAPARSATPEEKQRVSLLRPRNVQLTAEEVAALREKQAEALLIGVARVGVTAGSTFRTRALLRQVEASWHSTRAPGVHFERRALAGSRVAARLATRRVPLFIWPGTFNSVELTSLLGWPVGVEQVPGLVLGGCRPLAVSPQIPSKGTVIGVSTFPGSHRPVAVDVEARLRHLHVVGPTGTGKSTLLLHLIEQDLAAGHGVVVVDPKGDLVSAVLDRVPRQRQADVVVLDPADDARPVGLNPLRSAAGAQAEVAVENLVGLLKSLYRSSWGPRTDDILRAALLTLAGSGTATLCEVPALLTDPTYRRRIVGALDDPVGLESFWGWYEGLSNAERLAVVGPPLNKIRAFTMRPRVRAIVGQADPALKVADVLRQRRVLLVSLASGLLGEEAAALLGALVVAEVWHATTARAALSPQARQPVMAHLDEWQHFLHLPTPMPSVLAEARGLGLGLTLAHQHLGQLPDGVRDAVLANARSRVIFQVASQDARLLGREVAGSLTPDDLQGLGAFEVVAQLYAQGRTQPPVTLHTQPAAAVSSDGKAARERSRQRYGVDRRQVEASIRRRQQGARPDAPIGRRPVQRRRS